MIYSRMDNNFELVPIEIKGVTGWIYLYLRSFVGWILSFFDIYEIKERFFTNLNRENSIKFLSYVTVKKLESSLV